MFSDPSTPVLDCNGRLLALDRPRVMGIVNATPDSFSGGGRPFDADAILRHSLDLVAAGADLLDVGGESTRPGATAVSVDEELSRVVPLIERLAAETPCPLSVDTSKPEVMKAAVAAGAGMINDVYALRREGALDAAAALGVPVVLMHMQGEPGDMQDDPTYADVVAEVHGFLAQRVFACEMAGIPKSRLVLDPGFGFGKTLQHNLALLARFDHFASLGCALLAGLSNKRMIGELTGRELGRRHVGSAAAALLAVQRGALLVRVHDVASTVDALAVWRAVAAIKAPRRDAGRATPRWPDDDD